MVGGKVVLVRRDRAHEGAGSREVVQLDATPAPAKFNPLGGVAAIAKNTWAAIKGREALKVVWDDGPNKDYHFKAYKAKLEEQVRKAGKVERNDGDADAALKSAARVITAEYYAPHIAHATMEPPAAVARREGASGRSGRRCRARAAHATTSPRRSASSRRRWCQLHAARRRLRPQVEMRLRDRGGWLSRALDGAPVKVVWTREDDLHHGFYHTVTVDRFEAGLDASNKVVAWRHRSASPTILSTFAPDPKHPFDIELGMGWVDTPFNVPNIRMESGEAQSHTRIGWFRSVNN